MLTFHRVDATASVEREQRSGLTRAASLRAPYSNLLAQKAPDLGSERNEPGLAELAGSDGEQATVQVDVAALQAATFGGAETEAVEQGEERLVRHSPATCPSESSRPAAIPSKRLARAGSKMNGIRWVEDGRRRPVRIGPLQATLRDEPSHQPANEARRQLK